MRVEEKTLSSSLFKTRGETHEGLEYTREEIINGIEENTLEQTSEKCENKKVFEPESN